MSQKNSHPLEHGIAWYSQLDSRELNVAESLLFWMMCFVCICYSLEARVKRQKEWDEQQRRIQLVRALATPFRSTAFDARGCLGYLDVLSPQEMEREDEDEAQPMPSGGPLFAALPSMKNFTST